MSDNEEAACDCEQWECWVCYPDPRDHDDGAPNLAAHAYANEADGNHIDEFAGAQKLLMRAAFLAGVEWQKTRDVEAVMNLAKRIKNG